MSDSIPSINGVPDSLDFYREFVSQNKPVLIKNCVSHWKALERWKSNEYLRQVVGEELVTVDVTPTGYGNG